MNKRLLVAIMLVLVMALGAVGCAQKSSKTYYVEWDYAWLTPHGTDMVVVSDMYKPLKKAKNKEIGILVSELNGTPMTIEYPIFQKTKTGKWVIIDNGYNKADMMYKYERMNDMVVDWQ